MRGADAVAAAVQLVYTGRMVSPRSTSSMGRVLAAAGLAASSIALVACGSEGGNGTGGAATTSTSSTTTTTSTTAAGGGDGGTGGRQADPPITIDMQGRTYDLAVPSTYDAANPAPLLIEIHGFAEGSTTIPPWDGEESLNNFVPEADARGMFVALVHGNVDAVTGRYFWNATNACCDFGKTGVNDVGYIVAVVEDVVAKYNIDPKRIFVFGHSNGGFMANRLACDQASRFAGVVSLAGATYLDQTKCAASAPIAYLQVHGDADMVIPYAGGSPLNLTTLPAAPGAVETTQDWAKKNNCDPKADTSSPQFDIVADLDGAETTALKYNGCEANGHTELWTMHLGPHSPHFNESWAPMVLDFLMAHPKP